MKKFVSRRQFKSQASLNLHVKHYFTWFVPMIPFAEITVFVIHCLCCQIIEGYFKYLLNIFLQRKGKTEGCIFSHHPKREKKLLITMAILDDPISQMLEVACEKKSVMKLV